MVLFDLDGVLVDTQDAEITALLAFAERLNADIPREGFAEMVAGRRMRESVELIHSFSDLPLPDDAVEQVRELADGYLRGRLRAVPGVEEALKAITSPKYVVSNSPLAMIRQRLARSRLSAYFGEPLFSAYELQSWKPDPDLYRRVLRSLNVDATAAVAVEDGEVGVRSAQGAGVRVYNYRRGQPTSDGCLPSVRVFGQMAAFPQLLAADLASLRLAR